MRWVVCSSANGRYFTSGTVPHEWHGTASPQVSCAEQQLCPSLLHGRESDTAHVGEEHKERCGANDLNVGVDSIVNAFRELKLEKLVEWIWRLPNI